MAIRKSTAVWKGSSREGSGTLRLGSGQYEGPYTWMSRFKEGPETNPEELIGAAHAGCFSMALSHELGEAGFPPVRVATTAKVHLEKSEDGFAIPRIELETEADVPGVDDETFHRIADAAKQGCPVSKLLAGADITLRANLLSSQGA